MYNRNRIYINNIEQQQMHDCKIVFGGLGLGSVIAECALRMGFENLHLIDGDTVEVSNLNRQNYTLNDVGKPKCIALYERLKQINPNANITYSNVYLTAENIEEHLIGADIAVNAIDFVTDAPLIFDKVCFKKNISVVHPYNLGYGGLVCILTKQSLHLEDLSQTHEGMEISVVNHVLNTLEKNGCNMSVLKNALSLYIAEQGTEQPPQLSIASWILGGVCADIFLKIIRGNSISVFPEFYYIDSNLKLEPK